MLFDEPGGVERTKTSVKSTHDGLVLLEKLRIAAEFSDGLHVIHGSHRSFHGRWQLALAGNHATRRIGGRYGRSTEATRTSTRLVRVVRLVCSWTAHLLTIVHLLLALSSSRE